MNTITCLLIDDDIDDHEIVCAVLEVVAPACRCITATNGKVALELLTEGKVSPDIIFLDVNMPLMNGKQFMQEVSRLRLLHHVPVFVLSTSSDASTKAVMLELGAKDFITKPDKFSEWENVLRRVLNNSH